MRFISFLLFLVTLPCLGATTHTQTCTATTASCSSCTISCTGVAANATVAVAAIIETANNTVSTVSDGTNNYTKSTSSPCVNGTNNRVYIYTFKYTAAPGTITVTVTPNTTSSVTLFADEFGGSSGVQDTDGSGTCTGTGTAFNLPTLTPPTTGDFLYGACSDLTSSINAGGAHGSWTLDTVTNGDDAEWQVNVGTSAVAIAMASTASSGWSCMEAAYKATASTQTCTRNLTKVGC